jgi:hypothetical protein
MIVFNIPALTENKIGYVKSSFYEEFGREKIPNIKAKVRSKAVPLTGRGDQ